MKNLLLKTKKRRCVAFALFFVLFFAGNAFAQTLIFSNEFNGASDQTGQNVYGAVTSTDYVSASSPSSTQFTSIIGGKQSGSNLLINNSSSGELVVSSAGTSFLWCATKECKYDNSCPYCLND